MFVLLCLLIVCSLAAVGLAAVWAATATGHWFARTLAVAVPLSLLLLVPAYEPLVALAVEATVVTLGLHLARLRRERREARGDNASVLAPSARISFSISSLLWSTVLAAVLAAVAARLPRLTWLAWVNTVHIGVAGGLSVLFGAWLVHGRPRWWLRVPLAVGASLVSATALALTDYLLNSMTGWGGPWPPGSSPGPPPAFGATAHWLWLGILPVTTIASGLLLLALRPRAERAGTSPWRAVASRLAVRLGAAAVVVALPSYVLYRMLTPAPLPETAGDYPVPNGYDELLAAAAGIQNPVFDNYDTATPVTLEKTLAARKDAFARFRQGLELDSQVRLDYQDASLQTQLTEAQAFRNLARAVMAEGQFAEFEERFSDAAGAYADNIELGQRMSDGGMLIQLLVGMAIQGMGTSGLAKIRHRLPPATARVIAARLVEIEARRPPLAEFRARDHVWIQHALGWQGRMRLALEDLAGEETGGLAAARSATLRAATLLRLLIAELAVGAYVDEHGGPPERLEHLVPEHISRVPLDPFDGEPLRYARRGEEYLVYSIGADLRDDGGRPPPDQTFVSMEGGDVSLDGWYEWVDRQ